MLDIINRFIAKAQANKDSIYFLYGGSIVNKDLFLSQIVKNEDKIRNQMNILVYSLLDNQNNNMNSMIKSKGIVCPKCFEEINIKVNGYKISFDECKNGHKINNMNFKDFKKKQKIDLKNIICNECNQTNKFNSYNNQFYKCFTCNKNLCPLCKSHHDDKHHTVDYDQRNFICKLHFEFYNSCCKNCKINLCMKCEKEHINHEKVYYGNILPDSDQIKFKADELGTYIYQLNDYIETMIRRLNEYKENINNLYQIYTEVINNVDFKYRNYELLNNITEITENDVIKDIKKIIEEDDNKNKFNLIFDITDKIELENNDEITLIYKINNNDKKIKIFGSEFVNNNKNICKIIYEGEEIELKEYFNVERNSEKLEIKLKGINKITIANKIFYECPNLESMPDIIKWDLSKVTEMKDMFKGCNESLIIPQKFKFI